MPADVSILVNNVGCSKTGLLDRHSVWDTMRQVNVNVNSQTYMTYLMLPMLLERSSRSAIIHVSSRSAEVPNRFIPIYCATKTYNLALGLSLQEAYKDKIDVMVVTPHSVET